MVRIKCPSLTENKKQQTEIDGLLQRYPDDRGQGNTGLLHDRRMSSSNRNIAVLGTKYLDHGGKLAPGGTVVKGFGAESDRV